MAKKKREGWRRTAHGRHYYGMDEQPLCGSTLRPDGLWRDMNDQHPDNCVVCYIKRRRYLLERDRLAAIIKEAGHGNK